jgi:transcriptional regulator with XRE-family HTH domain
MDKYMDDRHAFKLLIQKRLEALLQEKGISRRQLADRIKIKESYLSMMIRGERPWKVSYLKQVADGLDISLEDILGENIRIPVVADIGWGKETDIDSSSFDYKAVLSPKKNRTVHFPRLPKSLAAKTYVVKITGSELMPYVLSGSYLYITRGLGNSQNLKDGDLVIYVSDRDQRGYLCRVELQDPVMLFHSFYALPEPISEKIIFRPLAETVFNIDVVVAIVIPRPPDFEVEP